MLYNGNLSNNIFCPFFFPRKKKTKDKYLSPTSTLSRTFVSFISYSLTYHNLSPKGKLIFLRIQRALWQMTSCIPSNLMIHQHKGVCYRQVATPPVTACLGEANVLRKQLRLCCAVIAPIICFTHIKRLMSRAVYLNNVPRYLYRKGITWQSDCCLRPWPRGCAAVDTGGEADAVRIHIGTQRVSGWMVGVGLEIGRCSASLMTFGAVLSKFHQFVKLSSFLPKILVTIWVCKI